jgi:uncharacterized membrane protein HdeD (DUF308 family)
MLAKCAMPPAKLAQCTSRLDYGPIVIASRGKLSMIVLGVILLIVGFIVAVKILWILGVIALVVGAVLAIAGFAGRQIGGRKHWY